jgi:NADPH:quinone reductase-like Zn-dependent oxidoreductase
MNAAVVHSFEQPPRYTEFADPVAAEGEALVTVSAAGLHPIVKALANGTHYMSARVPPFIPGIDGVGRLKDGSRVYFAATKNPFGAFAERSITVPSMSLAVPDNLDDVMVAAMMNPGMSSWGALAERAHFVAGENILILGATGAAGQLAVQIARRLGAKRVIAAGRNPEALAELKSLGADATISLTLEHAELVSAFRDEWARNNIDVVLDYVWGAPAEAVLEAISRKGLQRAVSRIRYVQIGASASPTISLPAATLRSSGLELLGSGFGSVSLDKLFASMAAFLSEGAKSPFHVKTETAALSAVESLWNLSNNARLVFRP